MLSRLGTALSVRARLIVLSLVPVVGLVAIGFAYLSSERTVEAAFESVQKQVRMADASRVVQGVARRVADAPCATTWRSRKSSLISRFGQHARRRDGRAQDRAGSRPSEADKANLTALEGRVANLKKTFDALTAEQDNLGLSEFEGLQGSLRDNGNAMERVVNEDMSWLSEDRPALDPDPADADAPLRGRIPRRPQPTPSTACSRTNSRSSRRRSARSSRADVMKAQLTDQVKLYNTAFAEWIESNAKIGAHGRGHVRRNAPDGAGGRRHHPGHRRKGGDRQLPGVQASQEQTKYLVFSDRHRHRDRASGCCSTG